MASEKFVQYGAIESFSKLGYEVLESHIKLNGNSPRLDENFRKQMNRLNFDVLQGSPLSNSEFQRIRNKYPKNATEAFILLRNGVQIVLDDNRKVVIKFLDKNNLDNNVFQITEEFIVVGLKTDRLDLLVLINGLPIANIELKRPGKSNGVKEAIRQINRYSNDLIYQQDLLNFIQIFVATNGTETKYFCIDPLAHRKVSPYGENAFTWMDENNDFINKLGLFINQFFAKENIMSAIFEYMTMMPEPKQRIIIMRPSQIHAANAVVSSVSKGMDCYVSSSTGSGKTLTSFKTSQILVSELDKKVIMLLDRNDLADQTVSEFLKFDTTGLITELKKGKGLHDALLDNEQKLVITTIQSFNKWLESRKKSAYVIANKKNISIIVDECHRSTSGEMFANLKRTFLDRKRNVLLCNLVGFTGTPLLEENARDKGLMTQVTFGEPAHIYTITEAIRDKTVIPFKLFTIDVQSKSSNKNNNPPKFNEAYFSNENRIEANANEVIQQFKNHTKQLDEIKTDPSKGFTAMFAADGKENAIRYWEKFRNAFSKENRKTAVVFSLEQNKFFENLNKMENDVYKEILEAYDNDFGTSFAPIFNLNPDNIRKAHVDDVIVRAKNREIDMLIVSDMLLTGFDCNCLNTIYLDKPLELHGLLQAASRTNRLDGKEKLHGNIVLFSDRDMEGNFKEAIKLFGTAQNIEEIIDVTSFTTMERELRKAVSALKESCFNPDYLTSVYSVSELLKIIQNYRDVNGLISRIRVYPEWDEKDGCMRVGTSRDELDEYYANIDLAKKRLIVKDPDESDDEFIDADFSVSTIDGDVIGYSYIIKLLNNFVASPPSERDRWLRKCEQVLNNAIDQEIIQKRDAIQRVFDACANDEISNIDELFDRLSNELLEENKKILKDYSIEHDVPVSFVEYLVEYRAIHQKNMSKMTLKKEIERVLENDLNGRNARHLATDIHNSLDDLNVWNN